MVCEEPIRVCSYVIPPNALWCDLFTNLACRNVLGAEIVMVEFSDYLDHDINGKSLGNSLSNLKFRQATPFNRFFVTR